MLHLLLTAALVQPADPAADWKAAEATHLKNIRQVTHDFVRAGEGYFSPDGKRVIFQAEEKGTGNPFYQIFVMDLDTKQLRRISPGVGRTTCAYFRPDGIAFRSTFPWITFAHSPDVFGGVHFDNIEPLASVTVTSLALVVLAMWGIQRGLRWAF